MFQFQQGLLLTAIVGIPALAAAGLIAAFGPFASPLAVLAYAVLYGLVAGALSRPYRKWIQAGRFDRDLKTRLYRGRRLYNFCWTMVAYCPPIMHMFLAVRPLKRALVTLFGCRAMADATFYPDTWLRDLPLLDLGPGAYLANRATIGTNTCLTNGRIVVGKIQVGAGAVVGHLAGIGNGARLGDGAELGFRASLGMRSRVGARSRIGGGTGIAHGSIIGDDVVVGMCCFVGCRCRIASGLEIPSGIVIPDGTALRTQEDVERLVASRRGLASPVVVTPAA